MASLEQLTKVIPKRVVEQYRRTEIVEEHLDYCSCRKPKGHWGHFKWHFRKIDEVYMEEMLHREMRAQIASGTLHEDEERSLREGLRRLYKSYIGTAIAYEECPVMVATLERLADEAKREKDRERSRYVGPVV